MERLADRSGVTLLELLLVTSIIAILASFAFLRLKSAREETFVTSMIADLHDLALAQEIYYSENTKFRYARQVGDLDFRPSPGVAIRIRDADKDGWSAEARHRSTNVVCAIFYGEAKPLAPALVPGEIECFPKPRKVRRPRGPRRR